MEHQAKKKQTRRKPRRDPSKSNEGGHRRPPDIGRTLLQFTKPVGTQAIDPFRPRLPEDHDPFVRQVFHTAFTSQWACLAPFRGRDGKFPMVTHFLEKGLENTTLHYALLYGSIPHFIYKQRGSLALRDIPKTQLVIKDKVLRQLRQEIDAAPSGLIPEHIFSVVTALAFYDINYDTLHIDPPNYPVSPLSDYQSLATSGYRKVQPCHIQFMYRFVQERGGIDNVTDCPTRGVLGLADLHLATAHLLPPSLANVYPTNDRILQGGFPYDEAASVLSGTFGSQFQCMKSTTARTLKPFLALLPLIRNLTVAIDAHRRRSSGSSTIGQLVGTANTLQRQLLSLCQNNANRQTVADVYLRPETSSSTLVATIDSQPQSNNIQLQLVRLASLIYGDFVTFPVCFASGVRCRAATQLHSLFIKDLDAEGHHPLLRSEPNLEMWLLFMGSLACLPRGRTAADLAPRAVHTRLTNEENLLYGADLGQWYTQRLRAMVDTHLNNADDQDLQSRRNKFSELMQEFLWWDHVMRHPFRDLWEWMYPETMWTAS